VADLNRQQFFHLTDNPDFKLDPAKVPEDNTFAINERKRPGLYTGDPEKWINGSGYLRPYVAEIHADPSVAQDERWNGEKFIPAEHFGKATVARVIPTDAYAREQHGAHGWIEDKVGTEFDTGRAITSPPWNAPVSAHYPFKGYPYSGPDARQMSPEERQQHASRAKIAQDWNDDPRNH
jgi:hypothetical protein